jgi:hypothetical protein
MEYDSLKRIYQKLSPHLNELQRRLFGGAVAEELGYGGISTVSTLFELNRNTITAGIVDLKKQEASDSKRIRKEGGGRKKISEKDKTLKTDLENLIEPYTRGDPESPLRWSCKSTRKLAEELNEKQHKVSHVTVAELLDEMGYSLQANKKTVEGQVHPDRNAQFEYINKKTEEFQKNIQPVISVDAKKKELVGNFKNGGKEYRPKGEPEKVKDHDFLIPELGKVTPFGVYDIAKNVGWVNVGIDNDTSAFAVQSIRQWWYSMGKELYPCAKSLLITADSGGSNGYRRKLWKTELQKFSDETGMIIFVCHFPPGTSKWNKIEHRLFSFISQNWRGKPLISHEIIINLIAGTTTKKGLFVKCELDARSYPKGIEVTKEQLSSINLSMDDFHGDWNYSIHPSINKS